MEDKEIFTITTLRDSNHDESRCVGFYFSIERAIHTVSNNDGDIYEMGYYPYCVIEGVKPGLYFLDRSEYWFKWNIDKNCYESLSEKPAKFNKLCCFGIG